MTDDLAIERIGLAGEEGKTSLTRYLKRYAPNDAQYLADKWVNVHRNSTSVLSPTSLPFRFPMQERKIAHWGLNRASWRVPGRVANNLSKWEASGKLSSTDLQSITETLAISMTLDEHPDTKNWLERASNQDSDKSVWRWHLAHTVKHQQWRAALDVIERAPQAIQQSSEFRYWKARTLYALEQDSTTNTELADNIIRSLAKERHYYGFLASAMLKQAPAINHIELAVQPDSLAHVADHPQAQRARELYYHKDYVAARREWYALNKKLDREQKRAAVSLANQWGWHDQAIVGALRTGDKDAVTQRFPLAYLEQINNRANHYEVKSSLALAIARRESSFMVDALSSANARGLMQVLPSTAKYLTKSSDLIPRAVKRKLNSGSIKWQLFDTDTNIEFGLGYINYLQGKLRDNPVLVAAAYNAGLHKVIDWLPRDETMPMDIWIDNIPFKETREYVKAVLAYQQIYQWQMGENSELFAEVSQMKVPIYTR